MLKTKFKFTLDDHPGNWRLIVHEILKGGHRQRFVLTRDDSVIIDETYEAGPHVISTVREIELPDYNIRLDFGAVSKLKYALSINRNEMEIWRSDKRPFRNASAYDEKLTKIDN